MNFDDSDRIAADYLSGDEKRRAEITELLSHDSSTRRKRIVFYIIVAVYVLFLGYVNYVLATFPTDVLKIDGWVYVILNLMAAGSFFKIYVAYQMSKARVYPLLLRFATRHPFSPLVLRLRDKEGKYDWNKVVPMK
jgi:uncharacterized YccA/Bax inhibitor family protein